jgi:hypothetical protein
MWMAHPAYLREKARQLRRTNALTIDQLAERLALPRTTVYYWVRDLPLPSSGSGGEWPASARRKGTGAMQAKFRRIREEAYELGRWEFRRLIALPTFRDFVCLFITEGYKRNRNTVSVANSDPAAIALFVHWASCFSVKAPVFSIQYHADQRLGDLREFWAAELRMPDISIRFQRKSNSGRLGHRVWRCRHGVLTVAVHDTTFRARLQGWVDCMRDEWLDSHRLGA